MKRPYRGRDNQAPPSARGTLASSPGRYSGFTAAGQRRNYTGLPHIKPGLYTPAPGTSGPVLGPNGPN